MDKDIASENEDNTTTGRLLKLEAIIRNHNFDIELEIASKVAAAMYSTTSEFLNPRDVALRSYEVADELIKIRKERDIFKRSSRIGEPFTSSLPTFIIPKE
jgi:hypothetical protein